MSVWDLSSPGAGPAELGRQHGQAWAMAVTAVVRVVTGEDDGIERTGSSGLTASNRDNCLLQ
jgi:hypothetical protein